jgi:hypothetical protein
MSRSRSSSVYSCSCSCIVGFDACLFVARNDEEKDRLVLDALCGLPDRALLSEDPCDPLVPLETPPTRPLHFAQLVADALMRLSSFPSPSFPPLPPLLPLADTEMSLPDEKHRL